MVRRSPPSALQSTKKKNKKKNTEKQNPAWSSIDAHTHYLNQGERMWDEKLGLFGFHFEIMPLALRL